VLAGQPGIAGDLDGTGPGARLDLPAGLAADPAALYFADSANDVLRRYSFDAGTVVTFAGTPGVAGASDGTGLQAAFGGPEGVALIDGGVLFVADTANDAIRRVDLATAAVTTFAGSLGFPGSTDGVGGAARFRRPQGLAFDGRGALWVADTGNDTVRRIDLATATVTTFAGAPGDAGSADGAAARFDAPAGIAADGAHGIVWVADTSNGTVRAIDDAGVVATLAGAAGNPGWADGVGTAAKLSGPTGLYFDGAGTLYVADTGNSVVRVIDAATGAVATVAGIPSQAGVTIGPLPAGLDAPLDLVLGAAGQLFVTDSDAILEIH